MNIALHFNFANFLYLPSERISFPCIHSVEFWFAVKFLFRSAIQLFIHSFILKHLSLEFRFQAGIPSDLLIRTHLLLIHCSICKLTADTSLLVPWQHNLGRTADLLSPWRQGRGGGDLGCGFYTFLSRGGSSFNLELYVAGWVNIMFGFVKCVKSFLCYMYRKSKFFPRYYGMVATIGLY